MGRTGMRNIASRLKKEKKQAMLLEQQIRGRVNSKKLIKQ